MVNSSRDGTAPEQLRRDPLWHIPGLTDWFTLMSLWEVNVPIQRAGFDQMLESSHWMAVSNWSPFLLHISGCGSWRGWGWCGGSGCLDSDWLCPTTASVICSLIGWWVCLNSWLAGSFCLQNCQESPHVWSYHWITLLGCLPFRS